MSRSNPTANNPNPCARWFEWKGGEGRLVWYDKQKEENIEAPKKFRFLVLDQLSTVTGYHNKKGGITANEVRNVVTDALLVKFFKGGVIAQGHWNAIKKDVAYEKGKFAKSVYIAFKEGDGPLQIGNIRMSGSSLGPWLDFSDKHRDEINTKAVQIVAGEKDTSGDVDYVPPVFSIIETIKETDEAAKGLDKTLQNFLDGYFKRHGADAVDQRTGHEGEPEGITEGADGGHPNPPPRREPAGRQRPPVDPDLDVPEDDIPF